MNEFNNILNDATITKHYLHYFGIINHSNTNSFIEKINETKWDKEAIDMAFIITIDSIGGYMQCVLHLINELKNIKVSRNPNKTIIVTIAFQRCFSAGTVLHAYGDIRLINIRSCYMIHDYKFEKTDINGNITYASIHNYKRERRSKLYRNFISCYKSNKTISKREIYNMLKKTTWLCSAEVWIKGFADDIINNHKLDTSMQQKIFNF